MQAIQKVMRPVREVWALLVVVPLLLTGCQEPGPRALLKGERYLEQQQYDEALIQLQRAVRLMDQDARAWNHLGLAYHGLHQNAKAQQAYQNALLLDHKLASARFNLGCVLLEQNEPAKAANELTSYTLLEPKATQGWLQLGKAHMQNGDLVKADQSFRQVLNLTPDHPEALNNLGVVQIKLARSAEAMKFFNRATAVHPDYGPAILNEAVTHHYYLKNPPLALKRYQAYLALDPRPEDWPEIAAVAQELEQTLNPLPAQQGKPVLVATTKTPSSSSTPAKTTTPPPPIKVLPPPKTTASTKPVPQPTATHTPPPVKNTTVKTTPEPAPKIQTAASSSRTTVTNLPASRTEPPKTSTPTTVKTTPKTTTPPAAKTQDTSPPSAPKTTPTPTPTETTTALIRKPEVTLTASGASIPRYQYKHPKPGEPGDRFSADLRLREGIKWYKAGRHALAMDRYKEALQLDPTYFEAWVYLAVTGFESADWRTALAAYEMARALKPEDSLAHYNFCLTLQKANYPLDALEELRSFIEEHPEDGRGHFAIANLYDQVFRNPKLARPHYQKVLQYSKHHPEAHNIRYWLNEHR